MTMSVEEEEEVEIKPPKKVRKMKKSPKKPPDCNKEKGPVFIYQSAKREWWQRKRADFA